MDTFILYKIILKSGLQTLSVDNLRKKIAILKAQETKIRENRQSIEMKLFKVVARSNLEKLREETTPVTS
jgi:hypothetical protein